jgi:hypothetical protein
MEDMPNFEAMNPDGDRRRLKHHAIEGKVARILNSRELASYRKLTGVTDSRLATQQLQHLVDIGIAARDGSRRAAKYRLAEDEDEDVVVGMPVGPRDRRVEIETFLRSHPQSQRVDIENATGLATKATQYWLRVLSREGRVRLIGTERSRSSRYEVISRDPDQ